MSQTIASDLIPRADGSSGADPISPLMPRLLARARRLSNSREEAEDLAQEAALRMWQALKRRRAIETPEQYAMTTLSNLARQKWRRKQVMELLDDSMAQVEPDAPIRLACADIATAIDRLPTGQAVLVRMIIAGEHSPATLAKRTGLAQGTVMSRLARARAALRADVGLAHKAPVADLF